MPAEPKVRPAKRDTDMTTSVSRNEVRAPSKGREPGARIIRKTLDSLNRRTADTHRRLFNDELHPEEYAQDRYAFDFALMPTRQWAQVDTTDDASYYGIWTCPAQRRIISFTEGDITDTRCASNAAYLAELEKHYQFHLRQSSWKGIDAPYPEVENALRAVGAGHMLYE